MGLTTPMPVMAMRSSCSWDCVPDVIEIVPLVRGHRDVALQDAHHLAQGRFLVARRYGDGLVNPDLVPGVWTHHTKTWEHWYLCCPCQQKGAKRKQRRH